MSRIDLQTVSIYHGCRVTGEPRLHKRILCGTSRSHERQRRESHDFMFHRISLFYILILYYLLYRDLFITTHDVSNADNVAYTNLTVAVHVSLLKRHATGLAVSHEVGH